MVSLDFSRWRFRDARFNQKLTVLSMFSSLVALTLTGTSLIALDFAAQRKSIEDNLSILSQVVGSNSSAALIFDDPKAAQETLSGLAAERDILGAAIFSRTGNKFASFTRDSAQARLPERTLPDGRRYEGGGLTVSAPIEFQGERIGSIFMHYDLREFGDRLRLDLAVIGAVLLLSLVISVFLSSRLKNITSKPILHLADVAREVTVRNDYSLRALRQGEDELGKLTDDFNTMLGEVQRHDEQKTAAERKFAFLAEASTILARSLDYRKTLEDVARFSIPYLADWCVVDVRASVNGDSDATGSFEQEAASEANHGFAVTREGADAPPESEIAGILGNTELERARSEAAATGRRVVSRSERSDWAKSSLSAPLLARGQVLGVITFVSSTSSSRYTDAEITVAEDLARRSAVAIDNARLFQRAEEAIRLRDDFISIASHELKTPLTTLQLQVQSLMKGALSGQIASYPKERILEMQASVNRQIHKFSRLISELLDASRLSTGRFSLELERMDLAELVRQVVEEVAPDLERSGCKVSVNAETQVAGDWDRTRIEQVVSNLVTNAAKYGAGKPIRISVSRRGESAAVEVEDSGIGIAESDQRRIFERFERAVSLRHFGGFGLGLFIARQNVAAHGGRIWVKSEPGKGSLFTFEVPLSPNPVHGSAA